MTDEEIKQMAHDGLFSIDLQSIQANREQMMADVVREAVRRAYNEAAEIAESSRGEWTHGQREVARDISNDIQALAEQLKPTA